MSVPYLKISRVEIVNRELLKDEEGWIFFFKLPFFYLFFIFCFGSANLKEKSRYTENLNELVEPFTFPNHKHLEIVILVVSSKRELKLFLKETRLTSTVLLRVLTRVTY